MGSLPFEGARFLVLGSGLRAKRARELLVEAGAQLATRFGSSVTCVVVDRSVRAGDSRVAAARRAAVPVLTTGELQQRPGMEALAEVRERRSAGAVSVRPVSPVGVSPPAMVSNVAPAPRARWGGRMALLSLVTFGLATPLSVGYGAYRLRSWGDGALAVGYSLLVSYLTVLIVNGAAVEVVAALVAWVAFWSGGAVHAYLLGERLVSRGVPVAVPPVMNPGLAAKDAANAAALEAAAHRRGLREKARELALDNPVLAKELGIGRPDRPGSFDDGGLVDVNAVSEAVLRSLPGIDHRVAGEIVRWRDVHGPFESCAELVVHTSLDSRAVDGLERVVLFLPR